MAPSHRSELQRKLDAHFATARSWAIGEVWKRSSGNWQLYAAVTGSALAMATNAAAGSVVYSGIQDVTTTPPLVTENFPSSGRTAKVQLTGGPSFRIGVAQFATDFWIGAAFVSGGPNVKFFRNSSTGSTFVKKLSSTGGISGKAGMFGGVPFGNFIGGQSRGTFLTYNSQQQLTTVHILNQYGWQKSQTGIAGFSFTKGGQTDYGWVRLEYFVGEEGLANQIEAIDWGYTDTSSTPEPSTMAMAMLAAGAAGITALRRRRKSAS